MEEGFLGEGNSFHEGKEVRTNKAHVQKRYSQFTFTNIDKHTHC